MTGFCISIQYQYRKYRWAEIFAARVLGPRRVFWFSLLFWGHTNHQVHFPIFYPLFKRNESIEYPSEFNVSKISMPQYEVFPGTTRYTRNSPISCMCAPVEKTVFRPVLHLAMRSQNPSEYTEMKFFVSGFGPIRPPTTVGIEEKPAKWNENFLRITIKFSSDFFRKRRFLSNLRLFIDRRLSLNE